MGDPRLSARHFLSVPRLLLTLAVCGSLVAGCGGSGGAGTDAGEGSLNVTWIFYGPKNDGGYNTSQQVGMNAMGKMPGVTINPIYNIPYSQQATQIISQAIARGSNVVVDTAGLGPLFTNACKKSPDVYCYSVADISPQAPNGVAFWEAEWDLGYVAGVAAGLMTKSDTVGFVAASKVPSTNTFINSYALGCQSVNSKCKVRVVFTNNYFDPPAAAQATNALIRPRPNSGAVMTRILRGCGLRVDDNVFGGLSSYQPVRLTWRFPTIVRKRASCC